MENGILQQLQAIMQRQRAIDAPTLGQTPIPAAQAPQLLPQTMQAPSVNQNQSAQGVPTLGFLGGLGDSTNAQTGVVDPSLITQLNQYIMKQQGSSQFPWQTTSPQSAGQAGSAAFLKLLGL